MPPKAQELLAYLLLYRERWHTRERLAGELWPEASPLEARTRLRRLIWRLQSRLGEDGDASRLLIAEADWLGVNPEADLWLDVAEVECSYRNLSQAGSTLLPPSLVADLVRATGLIHGELLDNWYQEWCIVERERLRIVQINMLNRLVSHYVASREIERGFSAASDILRIDHAHEGTHREMMRLHLMAGDRTGALRQFEICRQALDKEFGVEPERLTLALYEQIRREQPAGGRQDGTIGPGEPAANQPSFENLNSRLDQLQAALIESQDRLWRELHALHSAIRAAPTRNHQRKP